MDIADIKLATLAREHVAAGTARELRKRSGLSLADVADVVEVSPSAVLRWERGERAPRTRAAVLYGRLLAELAAPAGAGASSS